MKMINVKKVLSKLDDVQALSEYEWIARCPVHGDTERSLVVKSLSEHRVVIENCEYSEHRLTERTNGLEILRMGEVQCSHGCSVHSIIQALNFEPTELFRIHDECSIIRACYHSVYDETEYFDYIKNLIRNVPSTYEIPELLKSHQKRNQAIDILIEVKNLIEPALWLLADPEASSEFPWVCSYGTDEWPYGDQLIPRKLEL
jgi:hypothetical protein